METLAASAGYSGVRPLWAEGKTDAKGLAIATTHGQATVVESFRQIASGCWEKTLVEQCQDRRYYEVIEETLCDEFEYRYAVLENKHSGAVVIQPMFIVMQDITAGLPMRVRKGVLRIRQRFPNFLKMRILMVGCAAGEGQLDSQEPWAVEALREAVEQYARRIKASLILYKDIPSSYRESLSGLCKQGYTRTPSMPGASLPIDFENFEAYVQQKLSRIYRKGLRRKFRESEALGPLTLEVVHDVTPCLDEVYPLYLQTHNRSEFKFEVLTKEHLAQLGQQMPDRMRFFLWRHKGRMVAFAMCMVRDETLYDLNVGMEYPIALDLHMYFVTWRDIITWAIDAKLKHYHTGPLNYDPKLHLRMNLVPLDLYARHLSPLINPFFGLAMRYLQPVRYDATIRKFANADKL
ncbi:MAG: GNAT family N-acetyltransferase [Chthoniobacteraceae bacterium]